MPDEKPALGNVYDGPPVDTAALFAKKGPVSRPSLTQISVPGIDTITTGFLDQHTIKELQGGRAIKIFKEMADHSSVIGGCLLAIEMILRKVKWTVEPGDGSAEEQKRAELLDQMKDDMSVSWEDTISEILTMLIYGFSWMEMVYKIRRGPDESSKYRSKYTDGLVAWRKWVLVPHDTLYSWKWDDEGGIRAFVQSAAPDFRERDIPIEKSLLFRTRTTQNNPHGRSMLINAFYPWLLAKRTMEYEAIGVERDLTGIPVAEIPPEYLDPEATAEDKAMLEAVKKLVTSIRQNAHAGIIFPRAFDDENNELWKLHLLTTGGMKQFDTGKIIERYERRMAMSLLADMILMGHERSGSFALSRDKTTTLGRALNGMLGAIASVINRHALPRIYAANGWPTETMSRFCPGDAENADLKNLGVYVRNLAATGMITPTHSLENALREAGGLPLIDEGDWDAEREKMQALVAGGPDDPNAEEEDAAEEPEDDEAEDGGDEAPPEPPSKPDKKPKKPTKKAFERLMEAARRKAA